MLDLTVSGLKELVRRQVEFGSLSASGFYRELIPRFRRGLYQGPDGKSCFKQKIFHMGIMFIPAFPRFVLLPEHL